MGCVKASSAVELRCARQTMVHEAKVRVEKCLQCLTNHRCSANNQRMCSGDKSLQEHPALLFIEAEQFIVLSAVGMRCLAQAPLTATETAFVHLLNSAIVRPHRSLTMRLTFTLHAAQLPLFNHLACFYKHLSFLSSNFFNTVTISFANQASFQR